MLVMYPPEPRAERQRGRRTFLCSLLERPLYAPFPWNWHWPGSTLDRFLARSLRREWSQPIQVGAILDALTTSGRLTLHDVTGGRGNIDHVLVGPGGVFTIETKSHGGRRSVAAIDPRWLKQAYAQRKLVERLAERQVEALLVFSRAYFDRPVSRQRGVVVLPARMLAGHLERRPVQLPPEEVRALHARLATAFS